MVTTYTEVSSGYGVITGEHDAGKIRLGEIDLYLDEKSRKLMKGIKKLFDTSNVLNPGTAIGGEVNGISKIKRGYI